MENSEQVIYIKKIGDLRFWNRRFKRIYFGNEFCQNLIPSQRDVGRVLNFVARHNLAFTLLTCQVNDYFLKKFVRIFPLLWEGNEIILNDWGIFYLIKKKFKKLLPNCILGKFLANNINLTNKSAQRFLKRQGFSKDSLSRLEIEKNRDLDFNFSNPVKLRGLCHKFKISVYYPYSYFATARFCPTAYCDRAISPKDYQNRFKCSKECQKYTFFLTGRKTKNIILKGNTLFTKQSLPLGFIKKIPRISRLVYTPTIPV